MEFIDHGNLPGSFTVRVMSDWQLGSITSARDKVPEILTPIKKQKRHYAVFVGDLFDRIRVQDKRFSFHDFDEELAQYTRPNHRASRTAETKNSAARAQTTLQGAQDWFQDQITPIAEKVLSIGIGNHELVGSEESDPVRAVCDNLGIPYGGYSAVVRFNATTQALFWHGRPSIGSTLVDPFQRNLAVKRNLVRTNRARWKDPTLSAIVQGHCNVLAVVGPDEAREIIMSYDWDKNEMRATNDSTDDRWYACAGSLQKAFVPGRTSYVEAKGYAPLPMGCVDIEFRDSQIVDVREVYV